MYNLSNCMNIHNHIFITIYTKTVIDIFSHFIYNAINFIQALAFDTQWIILGYFIMPSKQILDKKNVSKPANWD